MYKRIELEKLGGYPFAQEDIVFLQSSYRDTFPAIAALIGDKVILAGMVEAGGEVTAGWISINNELVPFAPGAIGSGEFIVEETVEPLTFQDGASKLSLYTRVAKFSAGGPYQYADLVRPGTIKALALSLLQIANDLINHTHPWSQITNKPPGYITYVGTVNVGDIAVDKTITIAIPDQGGTDYIVVGGMRGLGVNPNHDNDVAWIYTARASDSFKLSVSEIAAVVQNLVFDFAIIKTL